MSTSADDLEFCRRSLAAVSRTFSRPIEMLEGDLEIAVTCGYLLCRLADTIEDHPTLPLAQRDTLYAAFLEVIEGGGPAEGFVDAFEVVEGDSAEFTLARNLARVMAVFRGLPADIREAVVPWVAEMTRGMAIYSHRPAGADGFVALTTVADLERYCYFVAGTVGHMLTDLFCARISDLGPERERALRQNAESFGLGLQLVNILKDITDDRERGWSFIPRSAAAAQGLTIATLCDSTHRPAAHAALVPIFARARGFLDAAFAYCLAIPPSERALRLFCLLPLWMAVRTLAHAQKNDAQFEPGQPVKITRREVGELIGACVSICQDDAALRTAYGALASSS